MLIGISGATGSGKTAFAKKLATFDERFLFYDLDAMCHELYFENEIKKNLHDLFDDLVFTDNEIDRRKLGNLVFNDSYKMKLLTDIIWKKLELKINSEIKINPNKWIILEAVKLYEIKQFKDCDLTILLDIDVETRKQRVLGRDSITEEQFMKREANKPDYCHELFDIVITETDFEQINMKIELIYKDICNI